MQNVMNAVHENRADIKYSNENGVNNSVIKVGGTFNPVNIFCIQGQTLFVILESNEVKFSSAAMFEVLFTIFIFSFLHSTHPRVCQRCWWWFVPRKGGGNTAYARVACTAALVYLLISAGAERMEGTEQRPVISFHLRVHSMRSIISSAAWRGRAFVDSQT
jgi:hypothetical protein